jgi:hypothetical protein
MHPVIDKLQQVRIATFAKYQDITISRGALQLIANLFLNPDCQSDIDLISLKGRKIRLFELGQHIITAAPSTLARYAQTHNLLLLNENDILKCFALDHATDIVNNKIDFKKNPHYALAHLLNLSQVEKKYITKGRELCDLKTSTNWGQEIYRKVLIPKNINISVGEFVYHHFGVIVAKANDEKIAKEIVKNKNKNIFIKSWSRLTVKKDITLDFSDKKLFSQDVLDNILHPYKVKVYKNPQDIKQGEIKFQK